MSSVAATKKKRGFDPNNFLARISGSRKVVVVPKKQTIFTQGDVADAVFYIHKRQSETDRCLKDWPGSDDRHIE